MRTLIIGFVIFLAACNGSNSADPRVDALQNQVKDLTQALAAATHEEAQKFAGLQLIGKVHGSLVMDAGHVVNSVNFGPCVDMGVLVGFTSSHGTDPLAATFQAFKQCTGYEYEVGVGTGTIATADRIFWDGPNCTGNMLEWESGGAGYNAQTLQNGVVFRSPVDGTELMVEAGQKAQPILIQSVWVSSNPGCQADVEIQSIYLVSQNDVSISGVPNSINKDFQLTSP